jgi:glycosyltransferase involved in cell wall biosynthesis/GT2 family glycosyltransferase
MTHTTALQEPATRKATRSLHVVVDFPWDASACMGTGAYSETMVRALAAAAPESRFTLIVGHKPQTPIDLENVSYATLPEVHGVPEGGRQVALPAFLKECKADVLFAPATLVPLQKVCPTVVTVHDLVYRRRPDFYSAGLVDHLKRWLEPSVRTADHVVAISEVARADLRELLGIPDDRITLIRQPVRETFRHRLPDVEVKEHLRALGVGGPYYFHVSNLAPHKNATFAMEAVAAAGSTHRFVFAGGGVAPNRQPDLLEVARRLGIEDRVQYVGRVDDEQLKALYQGCDAFLFPSLSEGWGLPVAEARALGARVFASPFVPAAAESQQVDLDLDQWAAALADPNAGHAEPELVDAVLSGRQLFDVLDRVSRPAGISGCTILRNGVKLRYPFEESVASYAPICDEIVICWDPTSDDETAELVRRVAARFPQVRLVESIWDMENRQEGTELARQTQIAFDQCRSPWTLYVQADEALHERAHDTLRRIASENGAAGVAFQRTSFFGSLDREIADHRANGLIRMFRTGRGRSVGDAMHVRVDGPIVDGDAMLFNYSRLGSVGDIVTRCTNLHRFYHDDAWLAARDSQSELELKTTPFPGSHPAPMEASYRSTARAIRKSVSPRISVHIIAQERDPFGADLLGSCLDSLEGYADQIVLVDNGLGPEAEEVVRARQSMLPITLVDARSVVNDFAELRNRALAATEPGMTHIHKIDSDEVYLPGGLEEMKGLVADPTIDQLNVALVHFMIDPMHVESVQRKEVLFRRSDRLAWQGPVHEHIAGLPGRRAVDAQAAFLHFGYCRPQWQTMLKWLRYSLLQGGSLAHYQMEFFDGVRRPWFRDGRTPDTILDPRRSHLQPFRDAYPPSVRPWLESFAKSGLPWRTWVNQRAGSATWDAWRRLHREKGSWEDTLEEMLARRTAVESPVRREDFRRGFSIIIPTWNNLAYLKKAIESIRRHSDFDHEIVLHVNDGSDGTLEWVRENGFKHTHTDENVGVCVAVNRATDLATRDLVMYWNDDMVALPEWDRHLVDYAERHEIGKDVWLSSTLIEPTGANADFIAPADYGIDIEKFEEARLLADLSALRYLKPDALGTSWAPCLMYRETFDQIGRFSEDFSPGFGSDPDLAKKLWDLGARNFISVGKSLVYHFQCKGTGKLPRHLHNDAYGTFLRKYGMTIHDFAQGQLKHESLAPRLRKGVPS